MFELVRLKLFRLPDGSVALVNSERPSYHRRSVGFNTKDSHASSGEYSGDCRSIGFLKGRAA
jgi:hypothetical protein